MSKTLVMSRRGRHWRFVTGSSNVASCRVRCDKGSGLYNRSLARVVASLPAMLGSIINDRTGKRKLIFMICLLTQRLLWFPIALVPLWLIHGGPNARHAAMPVFLGLLFVMHASGNLGGPAWWSWMADLI